MTSKSRVSDLSFSLFTSYLRTRDSWLHGIHLKEFEVLFESRGIIYKEYACFIYIAVCTCYKQNARYFILHVRYILEF